MAVFHQYPPGTPAIYLSCMFDNEISSVVHAVRVLDYFVDEDGCLKCRCEVPYASNPKISHVLRVKPERLMSLEEFNAMFAWLRQEPPEREAE